MHGRRCDVWAFGASFYYLATQHELYDAKTLSELRTQILTTEPNWDLIQNDPQLVDLLKGMLTKDQNKRITIEDIVQHPWLTADGEIDLVFRPVSILKTPDGLTEKSVEKTPK